MTTAWLVFVSVGFAPRLGLFSLSVTRLLKVLMLAVVVVSWTGSVVDVLVWQLLLMVVLVMTAMVRGI